MCPTCRGRGSSAGLARSALAGPDTSRCARRSVIRLAGQGEAGANAGPAGDLLLRVRIEPHPIFKLVPPDDVETELPIAPWEAALGR